MTSVRNSMNNTRHAISSLFAMALFALFAFLMLLTVVICAQGYKRTVERAESTATLRTVLGYVESKVRSDVAADGVRVEEIDGEQVLFLTLEYSSGKLDTAIYDHEGMLMEQFYNTEEMRFKKEAGQNLIALESFDVKVEDGVLKVHVRDENENEASLRIDLKGKREAGK